MKQSEYDVVVVGGSTSGFYCAEKLAAAGRRVLLLERKAAVGNPRRTWIVTEHMRTLLGELPPEVVVHRTSVMEMWAGKTHAAVPLDPVDLIVERAELLPHLERRARDAGVEVRYGAAVDRLDGTADGIRLSLTARDQSDPDPVFADNVVGADGVSSTIARLIGCRPQRTVPIVQCTVALGPTYDPEVTKVWFEPDRTSYFYWLIPHSRDEGVLGLVANRAADARARLDRFLSDHGYEGRQYQGAMIPLHQPRRRVEMRVGGGRVLLVGDAAAQVKVTTVGGVVSGLWGAASAARALERGTPYAREMRGLYAELLFHDLIRWSMDRFDLDAYETLLAAMNGSLTRILSTRSRDTMLGSAGRLILAQPRIVGLAIRSLLRPYRSPSLHEKSRLTLGRAAAAGADDD